MSTTSPAPSNIASARGEHTQTQIQDPEILSTGTAELLVADTADLRRGVKTLSADTTDLHTVSEDLLLEERTEDLSVRPAAELLNGLADDYGLSWALIARIVGVSPAAVRKWRRGETVTPQYHREIARLSAFSQLVHDRDPRVSDIDHWLEMPAASDSDVTRADLYLDGHLVPLLQIAGKHTTGAQVLDEHAAGWRERAARAQRYSIIHHEDGTASIVAAQED